MNMCDTDQDDDDQIAGTPCHDQEPTSYLFRCNHHSSCNFSVSKVLHRYNISTMDPLPSEMRMFFSQFLIEFLRNERAGRMTEVDLSNNTLDDRCLHDLVEGLQSQPILRRVAFPRFAGDRGPPTPQLKCDIAKAVADMLSAANQQIEEIPFDDQTFDRELWDALVAPKLDCNLYWERFLPLQRIKETSTRAALVAKALARVESKPWLVSMLLFQNRDILLSSYLGKSLMRCDD
jgi:hypothetical protein